jgi:hypothetical protein
MASKKAYNKALRAAKSVVAGRKQSAGAVLAGLALIAYLPACSESEQAPVPVDSGPDVVALLDTSNNDVQQTLSDIHDMLSTDVPMASDEAVQMPDITAADEGTAPVDEGTPPSDEGSQAKDEGTATDVLAGWVNTFPETCLQPTGESCTTTADCSTTSASCTEGNCMVSEGAWESLGNACTEQTECAEDDMCYQNECHTLNAAGLVAAQCCEDALGDTGCLQATDIPCTEAVGCDANMECLNDLCHVSQLSNPHPLAAHADECCGSWFMVNGCGGLSGIPMGCYPWGPPAPPKYDGVRLKDLLHAEVA